MGRIVSATTLSPELQEQLKQLGPGGMSEEESSEDDDGPLLCLRSPAWRNPRLTEALHSLDGPVVSRYSMRRVRNQPAEKGPVLGLNVDSYSKEWLSTADPDTVSLIRFKATYGRIERSG